jgi:hypothetical protein
LKLRNLKAGDAGFQIAKLPDCKIAEFSGQRCCSKKDLAVAKLGVARSETLVLSGTGVDGPGRTGNLAER